MQATKWGWALVGLGTGIVAFGCDGDNTHQAGEPEAGAGGDAGGTLRAGHGGEVSSAAGHAGEAAAGKDNGGASGKSGAGGQAGSDAGFSGEGGTNAGNSGSGPFGHAGAGHGGTGEEESCVESCSSLTRTPPIVADDGSLGCPASHPLEASSCELECDSGWNEPYSCGAGTYCRRRGNDVPLDESCADPYALADVLDGYDCACVEIPTECDDADVRPTCGDDGEVYSNECEMRRHRRDYPALWSDVHCAASHGDEWFLCDGVYCRTGIEICMRSEEPDDGSEIEFTCVEDPCAGEGGCDCVYPEAGAAGAGGNASVPAECCEEPRPGAVRVTWSLGVECPER